MPGRELALDGGVALGHPCGHRLGEEIVLVGKVVIDRRFRHAGVGGDLFETDAPVSAALEQLERRVHERARALIWKPLPAASGHRSIMHLTGGQLQPARSPRLRQRMSSRGRREHGGGLVGTTKITKTTKKCSSFEC